MSACSFSTLSRNPRLLAHEIPPDFRSGGHLFIPPTDIGSVPSLLGHPIAHTTPTTADCAVLCIIWYKLMNTHRHTSTVLIVYCALYSFLQHSVCNAPRPSEHLPVRGENVKTFKWDQRLQIQNLFPFILDIKFVGRTSRGHTGGRSHRISHPPFCGAREGFSHSFPSSTVKSNFVY